jgi:hypothetical protein
LIGNTGASEAFEESTVTGEMRYGVPDLGEKREAGSMRKLWEAKF